MITVASINGKIAKAGQDKISVFDNALLYAEGLFETLLVVDDNLVFLKEHLKRLHKGARITGLKIPVSDKTLSQWMAKTARAHPHRIIKLRLTLTSGRSERWAGKQGKPQVIIMASPHQLPVTGQKLHVSEFRIDQDSVFRRIKTISHVIHAAAVKEAKKKNFDDALMLNEKGNVAEVTAANIFWVKNNRLYTPPLSAGCLDGITRKVLFKEAKKLGYSVTEKNSTLENMLKADEIFITSSLRLVIPISKITRGRQNYSVKPGPVGWQLFEHFRTMLGIK